MVEIENPFFVIAKSKAIVKNLNLQAGMRVLDFGCGPGRVTIPLAREVGAQGQVVAVDLQSKMLQRVEAKAAQEKLKNILFKQIRLEENLDYPNYFDRAVLVCVLGEIPDRKKALQELFQALKPGGILSVTEIIADPHFQSQKTISQLALSVGFQEKTSFGSQLAFSMLLQKPLK